MTKFEKIGLLWGFILLIVSIWMIYRFNIEF